MALTNTRTPCFFCCFFSVRAPAGLLPPSVTFTLPRLPTSWVVSLLGVGYVGTPVGVIGQNCQHDSVILTKLSRERASRCLHNPRFYVLAAGL